MGEKFCPVCKNKNASDAVICAFCGVPFDAPGQTPATTVPVDVIQPELMVRRSEYLQHLAEYPKDALVFYIMDLDQPLVVPGLRQVVLGRAISSPAMPELVDLSPYGAADLGVSRQHAQISFSGAYTIADVGSTNGTWLNRARLIAHRPYPLHAGDEVRLGSLRLVVYFQLESANGGSVEEVILLTEMPASGTRRQRLTMGYLADVIQPYLAALVELQTAIDQVEGLQPREVGLNTISAMRPDLPIGISLSGASPAVALVKNFVIPWRNEHAADLGVYVSSQPPSEQPSPEAFDVHDVVTAVFLTDEGTQAGRQAAIGNLRGPLHRLAQAVAEHLALRRPVDQKELADKLLPALTVLATSRLQIAPDNPMSGS